MDAVTVDQSGRTDVFTCHTVLAFSNGIHRSLLIPTKVKRVCYLKLKQKGIRKSLIGVKLFAAGLVLLLSEVIGQIEKVTIDLEYTGWEPLIKEHLLRHLRRKQPDIAANQIIFRRIGKGARAHTLALRVYQRKENANRVIGVKELLRALE
ncbi:MAG: hypothetical protein HY257_07615 [Chloroflexi bacterium]|nr:hypothetical protein [Chloroflexota bacterium]